jgi:hypothetical protein
MFGGLLRDQEGLAGMAEDDELPGATQPHGTRVVVWDVPATIECGETFTVKVGVKCSSQCRPDGWTVEVCDHDAEMQASATTSSEPWPDTAGLHYAQVELTAPDAVGLHTWEARAPVNALDIPHADGVARFGVRAVPTPKCLLTVVAVDVESQTPVEGAKVVVHPYKTFTDEQGVAKVRVPEGDYKLFVSGKKYFPFRRNCVVKADVTVRADLAVDRELSDADIWF